MKTQSFFRLFCLFALAISLFTVFAATTVVAQGIDASKICYEKGTVATGGAICIGAKGAVPPGASIEVTDGKGNKATGNANDDGSFFIGCGGLSAGLGEKVTVKVNGVCIEVTAVFSCGGSNSAPSTTNNETGTATTPGTVTTPGNAAGTGAGSSTGTTQTPPAQPVNPGGGNAVNGNAGGANNNAAVDCSRIAYIWRGASVGGPVCVGRPGAAPAGATVTVKDSQGHTATGTAQANGSFGINCSNLVGAVGQTVTVTINGVDCVVTISARAR
ncbi:hypothetical protein C7N43_20500 [Sphingobacteriales bacterium UPWRP_1]|nr:hypothetical protein BVG80_02070 [Sphingobacteriales bacterium TSM_CSM]PSJ75147.1 hypothetical protein C7N43_20500 [Sphingobacteriales bacterium UPWRP_1]